MPAEANREGEVFKMVAGALMILLILFGLLELFKIVHI